MHEEYSSGWDNPTIYYWFEEIKKLATQGIPFQGKLEEKFQSLNEIADSTSL